MSKRMEQLDSMRGLAAISVLIGHYAQTIPAFWPVDSVNSWAWFLIKRTPLSIVQAGHSAVILFFVLSGFVLALPFADGRKIPYRVFLVKRIARIWLPYLVMVMIGWMVHRTLGGSSIGVSQWFAYFMLVNVNLGDVLKHFNLIGNFDTGKILLVVWSLVVEMRLSLVFPFLYIAVSRLSARLALLLSASVLVCAWLLTKVEHSTNISETLLYVPMFCVGILLANHREKLTEWWVKLSTLCRSAYLIAAIMMYTWSYWAAPLPHIFHLTPFVFSIITVACAIFIVCAVAGQRTSSVLRKKFLLIPGVSSYSLYLIHPLVLLAVLSVAYEFPRPLVLAIVLTVSIIVAYISYQLIERPSMWLGSWLAKRVNPSRNIVITKPTEVIDAS